MAIVKWQKDDSLFPSFSSFFDDFFGKDYMKNITTGTTVPAVNVKESEKQFNIELAAPGMKKEDFKIDVDHNVITISSEKEEKTEETEDGKYTRREYSFQSFARSFSLPDSVDGDKVKATYKDGVLDIVLPKKKDAPVKKKQIEIK